MLFAPTPQNQCHAAVGCAHALVASRQGGRQGAGELSSSGGRMEAPCPREASVLLEDFQPQLTAVIYGFVHRLDTNCKSFTEYLIRVKQDLTQWHVDKRFSQFQRLFVELKMQVSSDRLTTVPPLPGKRRWWRNVREERERKRSIHLSLWLKALLEQTADKPNSLVLSFLGLMTKMNHSPTLQLKTVCELARVGDLILFRSLHAGARLQRRLTGAYWDHVGLVVHKADADDFSARMHLLEATAEGITCLELLGRLRAYTFFNACECIAVRQRLSGSPDVAKLNEFLREAQSKRYAFDIKDLLHGVLSKDSAEGSSRQTVFCSSLTAGALKAAGIILASRNQDSFWPGCFAANSNFNLALEPGVAYGPEVLIEMRELELANSSDVRPSASEWRLPTHKMPARLGGQAEG